MLVYESCLCCRVLSVCLSSWRLYWKAPRERGGAKKRWNLKFRCQAISRIGTQGQSLLILFLHYQSMHPYFLMCDTFSFSCHFHTWLPFLCFFLFCMNELAQLSTHIHWMCMYSIDCKEVIGEIRGKSCAYMCIEKKKICRSISSAPESSVHLRGCALSAQACSLLNTARANVPVTPDLIPAKESLLFFDILCYLNPPPLKYLWPGSHKNRANDMQRGHLSSSFLKSRG